MDQKDIAATVDQAGWLPTKVTELVHRGIKRPLVNVLECMDRPRRDRIERKLERILHEEAVEMDNKEREELDRKLDQPELRYVLYSTKTVIVKPRFIRHISWIGTETWGCMFGDQCVIEFLSSTHAVPPMDDMIFRRGSEFVDFATKHKLTCHCTDGVFLDHDLWEDLDKRLVSCLDFWKIRCIYILARLPRRIKYGRWYDDQYELYQSLNWSNDVTSHAS